MLKCLEFLKHFQSSQPHEILCEASLNLSLGGVFQDFSRFEIFYRFWDFRKLALFCGLPPCRCPMNAKVLGVFKAFSSIAAS